MVARPIDGGESLEATSVGLPEAGEAGGRAASRVPAIREASIAADRWPACRFADPAVDNGTWGGVTIPRGWVVTVGVGAAPAIASPRWPVVKPESRCLLYSSSCTRRRHPHDHELRGLFRFISRLVYALRHTPTAGWPRVVQGACHRPGRDRCRGGLVRRARGRRLRPLAGQDPPRRRRLRHRARRADGAAGGGEAGDCRARRRSPRADRRGQELDHRHGGGRRAPRRHDGGARRVRLHAPERPRRRRLAAAVAVVLGRRPGTGGGLRPREAAPRRSTRSPRRSRSSRWPPRSRSRRASRS